MGAVDANHRIAANWLLQGTSRRSTTQVYTAGSSDRRLSTDPPSEPTGKSRRLLCRQLQIALKDAPMKFLIDGKWTDGPLSRSASPEQGVVHPGGFRHRVTQDGSSGFPVEPNRYHLYISHACPFSQRTTIVRTLRGLAETIDLSVVHPRWVASDGWVFAESAMSTRDNGSSGFASLQGAYLASEPNFTGRVSVPVLWDKVKRTIVNNESLDIIHMLNHEFASLGDSVRFDLYPVSLQTKIDALNGRTNRFLAAGVYNVAGAKNQTAYDAATGQLFDFLDELEQMLSEGGPFLLGSTITIADVLAFTALVRFDPVYAPLFRIGGKRLSDYAALTAFVSRLYGIPGIAETVRFDHILAHYFDSDWSIPSRRGIVPNLTEMSWYRPPVCSTTEQRWPSDIGLTDRQLEVLALLMQGKNNKTICRMLKLAEPTVKNHVTAILKALKVTSRTEAVITANNLDWNLPELAKRSRAQFEATRIK
jgi:glutathionyl-hydroquinone reductase